MRTVDVWIMQFVLEEKRFAEWRSASVLIASKELLTPTEIYRYPYIDNEIIC